MPAGTREYSRRFRVRFGIRREQSQAVSLFTVFNFVVFVRTVILNSFFSHSLADLMEFLYVKDKSEGKITGRSSWKEDSKIRKSLKQRAAALMLDFESNRELLNRKVKWSTIVT